MIKDFLLWLLEWLDEDMAYFTVDHSALLEATKIVKEMEMFARADTYKRTVAYKHVCRLCPDVPKRKVSQMIELAIQREK